MGDETLQTMYLEMLVYSSVVTECKIMFHLTYSPHLCSKWNSKPFFPA
jgi:hypothetical protein